MTSASSQLPNVDLVKTQKGVTVMPPVYVCKTDGTINSDTSVLD